MSGPEKTLADEWPLVTVLVGCYNHARFVVETLDSVRQQTYPHLQLIVWDDCSRDNSVAVIQAWLQQHQVKCVFLPHQVNQGLCRSLNLALALAQGKYIAIVAADDVWLPDRIKRHVQLLENSPPDVGVVYSDAWQMDEQGRKLPGMFIEAHRQDNRRTEGWLFDVFWEENFIPAMTTLIRRECYRQVGTYDEELCFEDWDMWLRISRKFRFVYDPVPSAKYRLLATSMARTLSEPMKQSLHLAKAKCFFRGWLNADQADNALADLEGALWRRYEIGRGIPWRWKMTLLKPRYCTFRKICLVVFVTAGLPFARFQQLVTFVQRLKSKLFRPTARQPD